MILISSPHLENEGENTKEELSSGGGHSPSEGAGGILSLNSLKYIYTLLGALQFLRSILLIPYWHESYHSNSQSS